MVIKRMKRPWTREGTLAATTGSLTLPSISRAGQGELIIGANTYSATFRTDNAGNVQLLNSDSGGIIVANANTALKICIGGATAVDPIVITNRTASDVDFTLTLTYQ